MILLNALIAISGQMGLTNFGVENSENRQTAFFDQPNELGGLLVIGLPLFVLGVPGAGSIGPTGATCCPGPSRSPSSSTRSATTG